MTIVRVCRGSRTVALWVALSAFSPILFAHHSFAVFDTGKTMDLTGDVKTFQWTNPHVVIWVMVKPPGGGEEQQWAIQTTSPGILIRSGWTRTSIKAGDHVSVRFNPMRDGSHGGGLNEVTLLATGQKLSVNFEAAEKSNIQ